MLPAGCSEVHTRIMPILQMRTQRGSSISTGLQEMAELDLNPSLSSSNACAYDHSCSVLWGLSLPPSAPASWPGPLASHQLQKPLRGRGEEQGAGQAWRSGEESLSPQKQPLVGLSADNSLGLAVGDHADDAHHQQSHANPSDGQDPLLVQFLSFCRGRGCEGAGRGQTHRGRGADPPLPLIPRAPIHLFPPQPVPSLLLSRTPPTHEPGHQ